MPGKPLGTLAPAAESKVGKISKLVHSSGRSTALYLAGHEKKDRVSYTALMSTSL